MFKENIHGDKEWGIIAFEIIYIELWEIKWWDIKEIKREGERYPVEIFVVRES
jgi:hypothetical protein